MKLLSLDGWLILVVPPLSQLIAGTSLNVTFFAALTHFLGACHVHTIAYNPAANGMVEKFHCQLKALLAALGDSNYWTTFLTYVLLGIRSMFQSDLKRTPAELVYATSLRCARDFLAVSVDPAPSPPPSDYVHICEFSHHLRPTSPHAA